MAAWLRAPWQHWLLISFIGLGASFTVAVVVLLVTGRLDNVYEAIYTWFPGRPWTHVMRDHPWLYVALVVPLAAVPFFWRPRSAGVAPLLTYMIFLIGFLGGHVFW